MKKPEWVVLAVALLALVAKLVCASTTSGTLDVVCFREFGRIIADEGMIALYRKVPIFNHTPLLGTITAAFFDATNGDDRAFRLLLRIPGILADFASVLALLWLRRKTGRPGWWALGLFAASPVAFMVSGFHGNFDSLVALGLLLAALACFSGDARLCGLCWGLACQVKIIPLLMAPVFFFFWWHRGQARRFFIVGVLTVLIGWAWPLCIIPGVFMHRVLDYNSMWGTWGVTLFLRLSGLPGFEGLQPGPDGAWVSEVLKVIVVGGVCAIAWRRRAGEPVSVFTTLSLCWLVFFVFAPGFGAPYLLWLAPFALLHSERLFAFLTAASSVALFGFYTVVCGGLPWDKAYARINTTSDWVPWLIPAWLAVTASLIALRRDCAPKAESPAAESDACVLGTLAST